MDTQERPAGPRKSAPAPVKGGTLGEQHLTFSLGKDLFAISIGHIREILQFESLTEVPLTPAYVRGVLNVRGAVVPVIDLSVRFARPPTQVAKRTCVVILEVPSEEERVVLGVLVDQVNEVLELQKDAIEPAPTFGSSVRPDFVRGVARRQSGFTIVLDVAHVLSVAELAGLTGVH
jgi:purine-binding chemotaxis protein CheW